MQKKLLTISLLVSGREETTEKCLDSLRNLRTQLDSELILVDTGCSGQLRQKLERYTDQIIDFAWCNDFAKARNAGLEKASGEWFLYLDDDEWFEDTAPISDFLQSEEATEYDQAVYKVRNYLNREGTAYTDEWVSRMIRIEEDTRFVGKVHEYMSPARGKCRQIDAFAHHYGYAFADEESREKHFNRNEPLLKDMIAAEPGNMQWRVQLVQEYYSVKRAEELRRTGEEALRYISHEDHPYINQCRGTFYQSVLRGDFLEEKYADVLRKTEDYLKDSRNTRMCQCGLYHYGIKSALKLEDYAAAEKYSKRYMEVFQDIQEHPIREEQERIISESIIFVKDAATQEKYDRNLFHWAISLIRQGKGREVAGEKKEQLETYIRKLLDKNGDFFRIPEYVWEIGKAHVVDLEAMLLELKFSQWMAAVSTLLSCTKPVELEQIKKHLEEIRTKDDLRYDYYNMYYADLMVLVEDDTDKDYVSMRNHFRAFAQEMLNYYREIYVPDAFEGEMEMLPDHCRAAVWIERMFACGEQNWEEMLRCLRECARAYPELGEQIKRLADFIGKEQQQAAEEAQEAVNEMQALVGQIKPKVIMMLEQGMAADAWQIVQQMRQMLPEDTEIKQLEVLVKSKLM